MPLVKRSKSGSDLRLGGDLVEGHGLHGADDALHEFRALDSLDYEHESGGRSLELHSVFGGCILSAIDDVGPLHEFVEIWCLEAELLAGDVANELGAASISRVEEV